MRVRGYRYGWRPSYAVWVCCEGVGDLGCVGLGFRFLERGVDGRGEGAI